MFIANQWRLFFAFTSSAAQADRAGTLLDTEEEEKESTSSWSFHLHVTPIIFTHILLAKASHMAILKDREVKSIMWLGEKPKIFYEQH